MRLLAFGFGVISTRRDHFRRTDRARIRSCASTRRRAGQDVDAEWARFKKARGLDDVTPAADGLDAVEAAPTDAKPADAAASADASGSADASASLDAAPRDALDAPADASASPDAAPRDAPDAPADAPPTPPQFKPRGGAPAPPRVAGAARWKSPRTVSKAQDAEPFRRRREVRAGADRAR